MAVQLHVAYSATFQKGVGVVAGGPYYCAQGSTSTATGACMASPSGISTSALVTNTNNWANQGLIDPVSNLHGKWPITRLYQPFRPHKPRRQFLDDLLKPVGRDWTAQNKIRQPDFGLTKNHLGCDDKRWQAEKC